MHCDLSRELISADLDDELGDDERSALARHLATCTDCTAYADAAARIHRTTRISAAAPVPDLTDAILEGAGIAAPGRAPAAAPRRRARERAGRGHGARRRIAVLALQYGLLVVALVMVVLSVPELFAANGAAVHTTRHLGGWDLAFAIGLLVAALQPWRARGLLPMAVALGGVMVVTAGLDLARGVTTGVAEFSHLLEVLGLAFLWLLATSTSRDEPGARGRRSRDAAVPGDGPLARLRARPLLHPLRAWAWTWARDLPAGPSSRPQPTAEAEADGARARAA